jgi:hypothetical protein
MPPPDNDTIGVTPILITPTAIAEDYRKIRVLVA